MIHGWSHRSSVLAKSDGAQLLFDFDLPEVIEHVEKTVRPLIRTLEKTLPLGYDDAPADPLEEVPAAFPEHAEFSPHGAWLSFERRLSVQDRLRYNAMALEILKKPAEEITGEDRKIIRLYSGFGGTGSGGERGVLYDYYTAPPIADMTWRLLNKISPIPRGARVLEPSCGTGVFFSTAPEGLALTGVELDGRTAAVARALYPRAQIKNVSFEAFNASGKAAGFDYVIGNAPFGDRASAAAFLDMPAERNLDRYFVSRGIDALKEGGVMAVIVHPGVFANESNDAWRVSIARKAAFLGAVKLNDRSFAHTHTQIQPDILFFRRHPPDITRRLAGVPDEDIRTLFDGPWLNKDVPYFAPRPAHVMGTVSAGAGRWGSDVVQGRVTPETIARTITAFTPEAPADGLYDRISDSIPLPEAVEEKPETAAVSDEELTRIEHKELRAGAVKVDGNEAYILSGNFSWSRVEASSDTVHRLGRVLALTGMVTTIREAMREEREAGELQTAALAYLGEYFAAYQCYPKEDPLIRSFIRKYPAVSGIYDGLIDTRTPILTESNLYRNTGETIDGHSPAVSALLTLRENMQEGTEAVIQKWFPREAENLIAEMKSHPDIFRTPEGEWQLREDFIAGSAWQKIDALQKAIEADKGNEDLVSRFAYGQEELRKAVGWVPIEEAGFSPHASWIPEEIVMSWIKDNDGLNKSHLENGGRIARNEQGKWGVIYAKEKRKWNNSTREWVISSNAGEWADLYDEVIYYLNHQKQRSSYNDTETFNQEHDEKFKNYIANHAQYRDVLEKTYNRLFNTEITSPVKTYPIRIDGWLSGNKTLKAHQWQSVHHLYRNQKGISALGTGFGKTLAGIALYGVLKQEGKVNRAFFQVPNNKVKDWVKEISDVLPSLKIAYIDPDMPGYSSREKRYASYHRIANAKFDVLIMPESAASEIQLSPKNDEWITENIVLKHMAELSSTATARQAERKKESTLRSLQNGKTNKVITFEDFGCNALFVDEAHNYKNLFTSSLSRETGLNDGRQSARAMALFKKAALIREQNDGKNVFLFTATPLTNSPLEYYNMMMYFAPEELEKFGIHTIDNFIHNFADIRDGQTYDWKSGQITNKRILKGFINLPALQNIFFKYTDYQADPKAINLEKPDPVLKPNIIPKDTAQTKAVMAISAELEKYCNTPAEERQDLFPGQNYLTFYSKLRTASLDIELYDPARFKNWKNPKLAALAKNAYEIYRKTGAGQLAFCDRVFSGDLSFNMHEKIKHYFVEAGFKESEIAMVNGFTKSGAAMSDSRIEKEASRIVDDFNAGKYKCLIGTTACIGEGLNLQKNTGAIHHFDIPFRPSDFIQRNGRGDRQGNEQDTVFINTYMAGGTIDNYSVNLVQNKANWIDELLKSKTSVFVNKDDETFVDANELLLALTEEWGDTEKAALRRAEMQRLAEQKMAEEENRKRIGFMSSLAMLRGSLGAFRGDTESFPFRQRLEKTERIEKTLLDMPSFKNHEIIGGKNPFLYSRKNDMVIMKGDYLRQYGHDYSVTSLDHKKQEFTTTAINPDEFKDPYYQRYNGIITAAVAVNKFNPGPDEFIHLPNPGVFKLSPVIAKEEFYSFKDTGLKEQFYARHLDNFNEEKPVFVPDGDNVCIFFKRYTSSSQTFLNPYRESDITALKNAARIIVQTENPGEKKEALSFIKKNLPHLFPVISENLARQYRKTAAGPEPPRDTIPDDALGLDSLKQDIERQRKERNAVLGKIAMDEIKRIQDIEDTETLNGWLQSAANELRSVKNTPLKEIKRQYDYAKSVEIGGAALYADDIPDRVSPKDVKDILIYNAQEILNAIHKKLSGLQENGLFDQPKKEQEVSNNEKPSYHAIITEARNIPVYFKENLLLLKSHPFYQANPLLAAQTIVKNTPEQHQAELRDTLKKLGCVDGESTRRLIEQWGNEQKLNTGHLRDKVHVVSVEL
jgi:hypothetical protein